MNHNFKLFLFIILFSLFLPSSYAQQEYPFIDSEAVISMDFQDVSLKDVLKILSMQSGLNFIASENVQDRKITLYLDKVSVQEAMEKLFRANNLTYELDEDSNIFIVRDWGKPKIETVTRVFVLKYATVSSSALLTEKINNSSSSNSTGSTANSNISSASAAITDVVKKILTSDGSVIEDGRLNSLVVTDIPSRMPLIAQTIASLDVSVPQVMLEVEMLDVSKKMVDNLGFKFEENPFTLVLPSELQRATFFMGSKSNIGKEGAVTLGHTYAQMLAFLRTDTDTRTLARPRLLTLNNEPAEIKITTDEVIGEKVTYNEQGIATERTAERAQTGISLRVTPQIDLQTGEITMFLYPSVKEARVSAMSTDYRDPEERGTKSLVRVRDGETIIVGGLIRNDLEQSITRLPILSDIPIVGALFRHKNTVKNQQRELLVFITPHIIKDKNIALPKIEETVLFEDNSARSSTAEKQTAIKTSLNSFEKIYK